MNISKLLGNRVLVEPIPDHQTTAGGIVLPQTAVKKQAVCRVVMVGTGNSFLMSEVKVGDIVRVDTAIGCVDVQSEGRPHRIHSILDVQAVIG